MRLPTWLQSSSNLSLVFLAIASLVLLVLVIVLFIDTLRTPDREIARPDPQPHDVRIMAWVYPGEPGCDAPDEYRDGRQIDVLKPEYFTLTDAGVLELLTEERVGCNGYSRDAVLDIQSHSEEQYVTVSGEPTGMRNLFATTERRDAALATLVGFVEEYDFTGVEIDFEGFGEWSSADYEQYKRFLYDLGTELHTRGRKLMVDVPPISNETEQSYYLLKYEDLATLPVDYIVIMAYDHQFDHGAGTPIAPNTWVKDIIRHAQATIPDHERIVIGIPSYGYRGETDDFEIIRTSYDYLRQYDQYTRSSRDPSSYEKIWHYNASTYVAIDTVALNLKRNLVVNAGITNISVWALGGNAWF
jgi:hypothetical protein